MWFLLIIMLSATDPHHRQATVIGKPFALRADCMQERYRIEKDMIKSYPDDIVFAFTCRFSAVTSTIRARDER